MSKKSLHLERFLLLDQIHKLLRLVFESGLFYEKSPTFQHKALKTLTEYLFLVRVKNAKEKWSESTSRPVYLIEGRRRDGKKKTGSGSNPFICFMHVGLYPRD